MPRLDESPSVLAAIKEKAQQNAIAQSTYGKRAEFSSGKVIVDFESHCVAVLKQRLRYE